MTLLLLALLPRMKAFHYNLAEGNMLRNDAQHQALNEMLT